MAYVSATKTHALFTANVGQVRTDELVAVVLANAWRRLSVGPERTAMRVRPGVGAAAHPVVTGPGRQWLLVRRSITEPTDVAPTTSVVVLAGAS